MKKKIFSVFILLALTVGCVHKIENHGHNVDHDKLLEVKPKISQKENILEIFGPPSIETIYGDEVWYYVSYKNKSFGFLPPKNIETNVVAINFNKNIVDGITSFKIDKEQRITIDKESTVSYGTQSNIIGHFTKNFRRFNKNSGGKSSPAKKPRGI